MFKKIREANRRSREFRELSGGISLAQLDEDSKVFSRRTGISTGEMMEVGIYYLRQLDTIDQTSYEEIREAMNHAVKAVQRGELKMLDGKTPINRVASMDDLYLLMGFVTRYRPIAAATIRRHG